MTVTYHPIGNTIRRDSHIDIYKPHSPSQTVASHTVNVVRLT